MKDGPFGREVGRIVLFDPAGRVFMFHGTDVTLDPPTTWWFTPGGGAEPDEDHRTAAIRETFEETGILLVDVDEQPCHERDVEFVFEGLHCRQHELYYRARIDQHFVVDNSRWSVLEHRSMIGSRWWSLAELSATAERVYPEAFDQIVARLLADSAPNGPAEG